MVKLARLGPGTPPNMTSQRYDLITIGAGSGGVAASRRAAQYGARVAIIESEKVGGTCVLRGCVPKKLLMYASRFPTAFAQSKGFGWSLPQAPEFDWGTLIANKDKELARLNQIYLSLLEKSGVERFSGVGRFVDRHTVAVGEQTLQAERILIATGGRPHRPSQIEGAQLALSSREFLDLKTLPQRAAIIGAGFIGVEFASMLAGFGVEVELFARSTILRGFDQDIQSHIRGALQGKGVRIHEGVSPNKIARQDELFRLGFSGESPCEHPFGQVILATGRAPNSEALELQNVGITPTKGGHIPVNEWSQTCVENIYAVGDVTGRIDLTPVAIADGRGVAETLYNNNPCPSDHTLVASAVFTSPPAATVGLSQEDAQKAGHEIQLFRTTFRPMRDTLGGDTARIMMKLVVDKASDKVLGCHMVGPDAPEIIQSLAVALRCGATKAQFDQTMAVHPTAAEEFVTLYQPLSPEAV